MKNELRQTASISKTHTAPIARWGNVPLGAPNCTAPTSNAAMAANAWI